jgi:hypothetical protein
MEIFISKMDEELKSVVTPSIEKNIKRGLKIDNYNKPYFILLFLEF